MTAAPVLAVEDLHLTVGAGDRRREVLHGVSFSLAPGEALGLVGESGSGKSMTVRAIARLLPRGATTTGAVRVGDVDVTTASDAAVRGIRARNLGIVFQDPRAHVNPLRSVGDFLVEGLVDVRGWKRQTALRRAEELLRDVGIPDPARRLRQRPHELSGGMLQRVMIASVLATEPDLVLADEPTTALDVTTQEEVMAILDEQRRQRGLAMLFISHDLDLADAVCDRIAVMTEGRIVEELPAETIRTAARHPYTRLLMAARSPAPEAPLSLPRTGTSTPVLEVRDLRTVYRIRGATGRGREDLVAVDSASFALSPGGSLAIVGESGSGKSTIARTVVGLAAPTSGAVLLDGVPQPVRRLSTADRRARGRIVQMVFQDPYSSLDPRQTVEDCLDEALAVHAPATRGRARVEELLDQVGLERAHASARPRALSGGQRQRVAIARALAADPRVLLLDEAVAALDVSIQAQVLALLSRIRAELGVALLFISHDLPLVQRLCDDVLVMHRGVVVESGPVRDVLAAPRHPRTRLLLESVPRPGWKPRRRHDQPTHDQPTHDVRSTA